jgi:ComEC/Rec2-related protein
VRTDQHIKNYNFPTIKYPLGRVKIYGIIEKDTINTRRDRTKTRDIVVNIDKIESIGKNTIFSKDKNFKNPKKLQIKLLDTEREVYYGKTILTATVFPIKNKDLYSDFDLQRYLYFKKIGGIGYRGEIIFNDNELKKLTIPQKIDNIRTSITKRIINVRPESRSTGIVAVLLTDKKNLADKQTLENMNFSGLAQVLSISGLHMMILINFTLLLIKWILLRFEIIALKCDVFKISAILSLAINFLYLLLSGANVAAVRSYIMSAVLLMSVIIGRFSTGMRSVMFVMFVIVFVSPSSIFSVAFQMSFMAVIALIVTTELYTDYSIKIENKYFKNKFVQSTILNLLIAFAATTATIPFSIYSFNYYGFFSILVNYVVTPVVSFIILPLGMIALLVLPLHLEFVPIIISSYLMDIIVYISDYVANNMQDSVKFVQSPSNFALLSMILGLLWFCLWKEKWRNFGIILYFAVFIGTLFFQKKPDIIIDNKDKMILFFDEKDNIYVLDVKKYKINSMVKKFGKNEYLDIDKSGLNNCNQQNKNKCSRINIDEKNINFYKNDKYINLYKYNNKYHILDGTLDSLVIEDTVF